MVELSGFDASLDVDIIEHLRTIACTLYPDLAGDNKSV
jgi:hypothetical protein